MTASPVGNHGAARAAGSPPIGVPRTAAPTVSTGAPLPRRIAADPTDETERLRDWGLLTAVLDGLTAGDPERCPGTLVVHADGRVECVEGDRCPPDLATHAGTATCAEVLGTCC